MSLGFEKMSVRYFIYEAEGDTPAEIRESSESEFLERVEHGQAITYERHTVRENGVSQICLTVGLDL